MEQLAFFLIKSVLWTTGFALVYHLFLRNERYFGINRFFLLAGIISSLLFPFITLHYIVTLPVVNTLATSGDAAVVQGVAAAGSLSHIKSGLLVIYIAGTLVVCFLILLNGKKLWHSIRVSEAVPHQQAKLIRTTEYESAFSFFSYVFVNPSVNDIEAREIMNHEMVHIDQKHWVDLVLGQMLCVVQWFNPVAWIYVRFIRQNHEYLADEVALQRSSDPAVYRAALLNQITGTTVVSLVNSFAYSLNKKRFYMMKNIIQSPYRKMKVLFILPVSALVLFAFARPEYRYATPASDNMKQSPASSEQKEVKGQVVTDSGVGLPGAMVIIKDKTIGTVTDNAGGFRINVSDNDALVVTYVGYKSKVIKPVFTSDMKIVMVRDTISYNADKAIKIPPPPPFPGDLSLGENGKPPLYILDGKEITENQFNAIDPSTISTVSVVKGVSATKKYGKKGENGAIVVTSGERSKDKTPLPAIDVPPPPPPVPSVKDKALNEEMPDPLIIVDGKVTDKTVAEIDPETIADMNILKDKSAVSKYGDKGKSGVIEINTKGSKPQQEMTSVVEGLPEFKGGKEAMSAWIASNLKYPGEAIKAGIQGIVNVNFTVTASGKIADAKVIKSVSPLLDAEARRVVASMPDWKPGIQAGKPVDVTMKIPIEFKMK